MGKAPPRRCRCRTLVFDRHRAPVYLLLSRGSRPNPSLPLCLTHLLPAIALYDLLPAVSPPVMRDDNPPVSHNVRHPYADEDVLPCYHAFFPPPCAPMLLFLRWLYVRFLYACTTTRSNASWPSPRYRVQHVLPIGPYGRPSRRHHARPRGSYFQQAVTITTLDGEGSILDKNAPPCTEEPRRVMVSGGVFLLPNPACYPTVLLHTVCVGLYVVSEGRTQTVSNKLNT